MIDGAITANQQPCGEEVDSNVHPRQGAKCGGLQELHSLSGVFPHLLKGTNSVSRSEHLVVGKGFKLSLAEAAPKAPLPVVEWP